MFALEKVEFANKATIMKNTAMLTCGNEGFMSHALLNNTATLGHRSFRQHQKQIIGGLEVKIVAPLVLLAFMAAIIVIFVDLAFILVVIGSSLHPF